MTKPFRITGPGRYRTRDGRCVTITDIVDAFTFCAVGSISGRQEIWTACGKFRPSGTSAEDLVAPWTAKPKPRKRRTRDVRMWTWIFKSTKTGQYKVAGTMFEDRNRVLELGVKPKRVVVKGVPVRK